MVKDKAKNHWLDSRRNVDALVHGLWAVCALLVVAGLFIPAHPHFGWDGWFGFFPLFGFFAYCLIVLSAKQLRRFIARDETYYGEGSGDDLGAAGTDRQRRDG